MAACCSVQNTRSVKHPCPTCGADARPVRRETLYHQVRYPDNLTIAEANYFFCTNPDCEVGYFTEQGSRFLKSQLREELHINAGWLCYCFDISKADYQTALDNHNADEIKDFVIEQTKTGSCACASRNPSGQCCLADFKRLEKEYSDEQH